MLEHHTQPIHCALLKWYTKRLFTKHFKQIVLRGKKGFDAHWRDKSGPPVIFYGNHQTWWDGFFYVHLLWHYGFDYAIMMEEKNLRKFRFFQRTGVFGVDLESRVGRGRGALYAVDWLKGRGQRGRRALVMYPHGRLVPEHEPLPDFQPGLSKIVERVAGVLAIPIFTKIHFTQHPLPNVDLLVGETVVADGGNIKDELAAALHQTHCNIPEYFQCNDLFIASDLWVNSKKMRGEA